VGAANLIVDATHEIGECRSSWFESDHFSTLPIRKAKIIRSS